MKPEEELLAKERLARRTFCPYCGANPGHSCYAVLSYGSALFPKRELPAHISRHQNVDRRQPVTKLMRFARTSAYKPALIGAKFLTSPNGQFVLVAEEDTVQSARKMRVERANRMMSPEAIFLRKFRQMAIRGVARKLATFSTKEEAVAFAEQHTGAWLDPTKHIKHFAVEGQDGKYSYYKSEYYKVFYR